METIANKSNFHLPSLYIIVTLLKESGSTWDMDLKLPKFAENAEKEFETIVSFASKVLFHLE